MNIQDDGEFRAQSEYIITFPKRYLYSDNNFKKLTERTMRKSNPWEWGSEYAFILLDFSF